MTNPNNRPIDHMRTVIADRLFQEAAAARARIDKWMALGTKAEIALAKLEAEEDAFTRAAQLVSSTIPDPPGMEDDDRVLEQRADLVAAGERLLEYFDQDVADDDAHTIGLKAITHGTRGRANDLRAAIAQAKGGAP